MKLKLISDGTVTGTKLVAAETGEPIGLIQDIRIRMRSLEAPMVEALITCVGLELELVGEFKEKYDAPFPKEAVTRPSPRPGIYADTGGMKVEPVSPMAFEDVEAKKT